MRHQYQCGVWAMNIVCTSSWPAKVRAMMQPKSPSAIRSLGSSTRVEDGALEVLDIPRCVAWCPCVFWMSFHGVRGGNRYSVIAKVAYTSSASAPMNHAERPLFVTIAAVMVERRIITTAPGQNWRLIGVGPMA